MERSTELTHRDLFIHRDKRTAYILDRSRSMRLKLLSADPFIEILLRRMKASAMRCLIDNSNDRTFTVLHQFFDTFHRGPPTGVRLVADGLKRVDCCLLRTSEMLAD